MSQRTQHPIAQIVGTYARPYASRFSAGIFLQLLARIPQRVPALVIGVAVDALLIGSAAYTLPLVPDAWIPTGQTAQFWFTVGLLALAVSLRGGLDWLSALLTFGATVDTIHDVRIATYDAVLGLEMGYFDDTGSGSVMSVLNNDVNNLRNLSGALTRAIMFGGQVVVAYAFMLLLNWQLALAVGLFPVVLAGGGRIYSRLLEQRYTRVREQVGSVNDRLGDAIDGISTVKAFTKEAHESRRLAAHSREYLKANWSTVRLRVGFDGFSWSLSNLTHAGLLLFGGFWVLNGPPLFFTRELTAGTLFTFLMYTKSFLAPVRAMSTDVIDAYENGHASAKRVYDTLTETRTVDADDGPDIAVTDGHVAYEDVTFSYTGDGETISGVSFDARPGELVGVVGSTGAGKSTLLKLLFRFYDPDSGTIRIDGRAIQSHSIRSVRDAIGFVSQDPFLFDGTVRENVAYAEPGADHERIVRAAKLAGAHEFITDLDAGYDTEVGERGVLLSGGQRQRIAIARAILHDPDILVFDEATSHVDNETEIRIKESFDSLAADHTTFVIAHRLSTVRDADRILVLDDGELVEEGTHEGLLDRDGIYADLWRVQVGEFDAVSESFVADGGARESGREVGR
ncbi:ABC transporter ATP-binding protein [Halobacteriales archaeon QS_4_69_31]|nr:MAG: ABC transporter ATP-binding protein [Halobacteriales archaeon QS_4_69_31]